MGWIVTDKRGGANTIHSWDMALHGPVSVEQCEMMEIMLRGRRLNKYRRYKGEEGRPLTIGMIRELFDHPNLEGLLNDLTDKGYLVYRHPRIWIDGYRVEDDSEPKGYDFALGQLSLDITRLLNGGCICPTIVPTDVRHIGIIVEGM